MKRSCSSAKRWTLKIRHDCEESFKKWTLQEADKPESISRLRPKIQASTLRTGFAIVKRYLMTHINAPLSKVTQGLPIRRGVISRSLRLGILRAGPTSSKTIGITISRPPRLQSSLKRALRISLIVLKALLMPSHQAPNRKCRYRSIWELMNNAPTFQEMLLLQRQPRGQLNRTIEVKCLLTVPFQVPSTLKTYLSTIIQTLSRPDSGSTARMRVTLVSTATILTR